MSDNEKVGNEWRTPPETLRDQFAIAALQGYCSNQFVMEKAVDADEQLRRGT